MNRRGGGRREIVDAGSPDSVAQPIVTGIVPASGFVLGGLAVVISGTHLTGVNAVTIGGSQALLVVNVNDSVVTAVTPALSVGAKDVIVTKPSGASTPLVAGFSVS